MSFAEAKNLVHIGTCGYKNASHSNWITVGINIYKVLRKNCVSVCCYFCSPRGVCVCVKQGQLGFKPWRLTLQHISLIIRQDILLST